MKTRRLNTRTRYLLICLMEEAAEIQKEAAKVLRFGPGDRYQDTTPKARLELELNDLLGVWHLLGVHGFKLKRSKRQQISKRAKLYMAMRYSEAKGLL